MNDHNIQNCKRELYHLYKKFGLITRLYIQIRILTTPLFEIEKYVPKTGHILDIGCGHGIFSNILCIMSEHRSVTGFDISPKRIAMAKDTIRDVNRLSFHIQEVKNARFNDFSILTITDLLHHIPYQEQEILLNKIYSGLKVPSLLILKDINKKPIWKYTFHYIQDSISYRSKLFFRSSTEMIKLLNNIGFTVTIKHWISIFPIHIFCIFAKNKHELLSI